MILKASSSTPLLGELTFKEVGEVEFSSPLRRRSSSKSWLLHLRCNSSGFVRVRSENDLHMLDREKGRLFHGDAADEKPPSYMPRMKMDDYSDRTTEKYSGVRSVGHETEMNLLGVGGGVGIGHGEDFSGGEGDDYNNNLDGFYRKMLQANPGNPLLLRNYARFLYEVRNDVRKAEEYYERAILAGSGDGEVLCLYAKLIWEIYNDERRAESYFHRAAEAAPDDCYVVGEYAQFLWSTEEKEAPVEDPHIFYNGSTGTMSMSANCC